MWMKVVLAKAVMFTEKVKKCRFKKLFLAKLKINFFFSF